MKNIALLVLALSSLLCPTITRAQWQLDGVPLAAFPNTQGVPVIASDGAGGAIMAWYDNRGANYDVYAQRVNASGVTQWTAGGVAICTAANDQLFPAITPDGSGGAIVVWTDYRNGGPDDVYAQRINASGALQWAANGVVITIAPANQANPAIVADGVGGAIVAWEDYRGGDSDVYAQRVNGAGVAQWTANGVPVMTAPLDQSAIALVSDGAGGVVMTWQDSRTTNYDIYAERVNSSGSLLWVFPAGLCVTTGNQQYPAITSDGAAGGIVVWQDSRSGSNNDVYAQRVNASGTILWTSNGVALSTVANNQSLPAIASDGAGGAIATWNDSRSGSSVDIYAQRVGPLGNALWTVDGLAVCTSSGDQNSAGIVADGVGGAILSWTDFRNSTGYDIYAQRLNSAGTVSWATDGVPVCTAAANQLGPKVVSDGSGGGIVVWADFRTGDYNIYTQRVEGRYGYWGRPEPILDVVKDNKNDQGGKVVLNWRPSGRDAINQQTIYSYSIWRALDVAPAQALLASGNASLVDTPSSKKANTKGHTLWIERSAATSYYWELVGSMKANYSEAYSYLAATRQDSVATNPGTTNFRIVAESYNQFTNWPSNVMSGRSVDNLAPDAPLLLTAQRVASDVHLKWNRVHVSDLKNYSVYRKTSTGVTPIPANFLATNTDTVLVDASAPASALYYIVTAYDVHANQSAPSNEASVGTSTHVGDLPPISRLTVLQNRPNPFAQSTALEIGLPSAETITVNVYDVAGRRVREINTAGVKGWQQIALTGVDERGAPLASGVYFYKIHAGSETLTRKMLIAR
ncbi:MAG TPA: T9SS type A sorting domain-containing protein [Candidatus Krumholzibacteria bacterium]|nr:T9SS type A sorting domain-containing protein [Candidatus Krumholzibacteria bacterium]